jgi:hypothetical protein
MTEPSKQDQQEPSMEEILASIRRIISDDGQEQPGGDKAAADSEEPAARAPAAAPPPKAPAAERPGHIDLSARRDPGTEPEPEPGADAADAVTAEEPEDEPLMLTQAVQDDGTVIDLAAQRAAAQSARAPEPEPAADPEPQPEAPGEAGRVELEFYEDEQDEGPAEPAPGEPEMSESERSQRDRLVSEATEAATLAALSELAREERESGPISLPGGERTLEQVVRDAISEHLRSWLDANLPTLVERIVREEVRRMARRAED